MVRSLLAVCLVPAALWCGSARCVASTSVTASMSTSTISSTSPDSPAAAMTDVSETVATIVTAKAGRSSTRLAAGLTGDWANASAVPAADRLNDLPSDSKPLSSPHAAAYVPRDALGATEYGTAATPDENDLALATHAVALPLPPALLATLPGLAVAYFARRRFAQR